MTSSRPYRAGLPLAEVLQRIEAELGRQFDASLGRHLIELGRAGLLDPIIGHSDDGIPLQHCALCGPTLVLRREQRAGEHIACPSCGGEHRLERDAAGALQARATGQQAAVSARLPQPDLALIQRFVRDSAHGLQHSLN